MSSLINAAEEAEMSSIARELTISRLDHALNKEGEDDANDNVGPMAVAANDDDDNVDDTSTTRLLPSLTQVCNGFFAMNL